MAAAPTVRVTGVTARAGGAVVTTLPRDTPLRFDVRYRVAGASVRNRLRARVRIDLQRLTSRLAIVTRPSSAYAETGRYRWTVRGPGVRVDSRYPAGRYRMAVRVDLVRRDGRVVARHALQTTILVA